MRQRTKKKAARTKKPKPRRESSSSYGRIMKHVRVPWSPGSVLYLKKAVGTIPAGRYDVPERNGDEWTLVGADRLTYFVASAHLLRAYEAGNLTYADPPSSPKRTSADEADLERRRALMFMSNAIYGKMAASSETETPEARREAVDHPRHYNAHPSGVECIDIVEHMGFSIGNAIKYLWRAGEKGDALEDMRKARWYIDREIARLERERAGKKVSS